MNFKLNLVMYYLLFFFIPLLVGVPNLSGGGRKILSSPFDELSSCGLIPRILPRDMAQNWGEMPSLQS